MKTHLNNNSTFLFVELPQDVQASDYEVNNYDEGNLTLDFHYGQVGARTDSGSIVLPSGQWELIGLSTELTEEQTRELVLRWDNGQWNDYVRHLDCVRTAEESLASLIQSLGMKSPVAILKLIKE